MSERIAVDYTIEVSIRKVLDKGFLEDNDQAPTGDEDALADWLENNPDAVSRRMLDALTCSDVRSCCPESGVGRSFRRHFLHARRFRWGPNAGSRAHPPPFEPDATPC